jgi:hypothetical protein
MTDPNDKTGAQHAKGKAHVANQQGQGVQAQAPVGQGADAASTPSAPAQKSAAPASQVQQSPVHAGWSGDNGPDDGGRDGNGESKGGGGDGNGGNSDSGQGFPKGLVADPVLTERHNALVSALLGGGSLGASRPIYWNGIDHAGFTLASIHDALDAAIPPRRPTKDLPRVRARTKSGRG